MVEIPEKSHTYLRAASVTASALTIPVVFEIATWHRFQKAAVSLTFDDGTLDQYLVAYPELSRRGLEATFFVITDAIERGFWEDFDVQRRLFGWDQAREMATAGHEIASHGKSHLELLEGDASMSDELLISRDRIEEEIPDYRCVSFAWPFWRSSDSSRAAARQHYLAARIGGVTPSRFSELNGGVAVKTPPDFLRIDSLGILGSDPLSLWEPTAALGYESGGWLVVNLHGIDDPGIDRDALGWSALPLDEFRSLLDYLEEKSLWIAPFGTVARYIRERDTASLRLLDVRADSLALALTDGLQDDLFDAPLSIRLWLPSEWRELEVRQGDRAVWSRRGPAGVLFFDAVPDRGTIVVTRG
jgi:chitin deacetylase